MSLPADFNMNMPTMFALVLPPNTRQLCRLVWQSRENIGVEFLSVGTAAAAKAIRQPQYPLQRQPKDGQQRAAGPARNDKQWSTGLLPQWNYWENQRPKRK